MYIFDTRMYKNSDQNIIHYEIKEDKEKKQPIYETLNGFCGGNANGASSEDDDARTDDGDARRLLSDDDDGGEKRTGGDGAQTRRTTRDDAQGTNA